MTEPLTTEKVWKLLSRKLRSFILSRVSSEQTADDLLQAVFLRIHQNIETVRDEERLAAWVFQIARNLIADHYRRRSDAALSERDTAAETAVNNRNEEVMLWLPAAIESLPETYREAVRLYELEGVPQQVIASRLGLSLSGAKSRIQRGRSKLIDLIHDCCTFELDARGNVLDYQANDCRRCCADGREGSC